MLRKWQKHCIDTAIRKYQSGKNHFLCLASPAAGKTVMAAEVAKKLLELKLIDLIICFAPSTEVVSSIETTFSRILKSNFHGGFGAVGAAYTYHSLKYFDESFLDSLKQHRILVIFDEIHHCSGDSLVNANVWGEKILTHVQHCACYSLALTGTPWRTDNVPIVLANYTNHDGGVSCDYVYGLHDAIIDGVCRKPKIVLVNSKKLIISSDGKMKTYGSISELLRDGLISYHSLVWHPTAMKYIIKAACEKLSEIRKTNINAGGLIVATSVEHAYQLLKILKSDFSQTATIVTYQDKDSVSKIANYRQDTTEWIVSVGMISEGTDIPRLQVCCHLSTVKTELYFRQILGRILRVSKEKNQEAWLFSMATDEIIRYSERLGEDLPNDYNILHKKTESLSFAIFDPLPSPLINTPKKTMKHIESIDIKLAISEEKNSNAYILDSTRKLELSTFHQRVIDAFLFCDF